MNLTAFNLDLSPLKLGVAPFPLRELPRLSSRVWIRSRACPDSKVCTLPIICESEDGEVDERKGMASFFFNLIVGVQFEGEIFVS